jgi:hypothetical protein
MSIANELDVEQRLSLLLAVLEGSFPPDDLVAAMVTTTPDHQACDELRLGPADGFYEPLTP